jgi:hypothetical protein
MLWPARRRSEAIRRAAMHDAYELRTRYGANAEQWCEIGILGARDPEKRRQLESIRAALAEMPW